MKTTLAIFISIASAVIALAQSTPREIAQKSFPSVVLLVMDDAHGQPLAMGSGFFVATNVIASNRHVVEGASGGYAKLVGQKQKYELKGILNIDERNDLVLLKIEGCDAPALELADSAKVVVGDTIYSVGNPKGLEGTFASGIVSGIRQIEQDSLLQITSPISPGSSGGPILNDQGKVIGVAVATFKSGQNLNFAIPANCLAKLVSKTAQKSEATLPSDMLKGFDVLKQQTATNSILSGFGGKSPEGVELGSFTWTYNAMQNGNFSLSIRNRLHEPVKNVSGLIIFYDRSGEPIETKTISSYYEIIPPGLAKRVSGEVLADVQKMTTREGSDQPDTKIEFRVLGFDITEEQSN